MIYFDTAATALQKPQAVTDAVVYGLTHFGNPSRSAYGPSLTAARAVHAARESVGGMFGAKVLNVAFTSNVTESLNAVIHSLIKPGSHVITTELEHNSVLRPLYKSGAALSFIRCAERNDMRAYERALRPDTVAVVATHASNLTGDMLPIAGIGDFCRANGLIFILDTAQTAGGAAADFSAADVVCFTGHKGLMGPMGVGGVCVLGDLAFEPFKAGGSGFATFEKAHPQAMPACFEAGTLNAPAIAGLDAGIRFINETGLGNIRDHELGLMRYFYVELTRLPEITVYGDFSDMSARAAIVAFNINGRDSGEVSSALWDRGIACRGGFHCAPLLHRALGTDKQGAVRISFGWFNTRAEVDELLAAVESLTRP